MLAALCGRGDGKFGVGVPGSGADAPILFCSMGTGEGESFFTEWEETFDSFDQMGLHENLLRGIYAYGEQLWQKLQA